MERLDLSQKPAHSLQESAIHCARYANILHLVKDKVVLDIACGEGYGSALMRMAGAKRVVGIDISEDSIKHAKKLFVVNGAEYIAGDANTVSEMFGSDVFDIVVSIETLEHIDTPEVFLKAIKSVSKENAIYYVTCPNDYWYYPTDEESNPYHVRKYNFEEFHALTTSILGDNAQWAYGCAAMGFTTSPIEQTQYHNIGSSWLQVANVDRSILINNSELETVNAKNCSFFVGLWNAPKASFGNSVFPLNMDAYSRLSEELENNVIKALRDDQAENKKALNILREDINTLSSQLKNSKLMVAAIRAENAAVRAEISERIALCYNLQTKNAELLSQISLMEVPYYRYMKLAKLIPQPLKRIIINSIRLFRK